MLWGRGGREGDDEMENHGTASFEQVGKQITMKTMWRRRESGAVPPGGGFECALCVVGGRRRRDREGQTDDDGMASLEGKCEQTTTRMTLK